MILAALAGVADKKFFTRAQPFRLLISPAHQPAKIPVPQTIFHLLATAFVVKGVTAFDSMRCQNWLAPDSSYGNNVDFNALAKKTGLFRTSYRFWG
jgi:hypothetical protein